MRYINITDTEGLASWETPTRSVARIGYFDYYMRGLREYANVDLDVHLFEAMASRLIPRAIGYSAALLDYFFRGKFDDPGDGRPFIEVLKNGHVRVNIKNGSGERMSGTLMLYQDSGEEEVHGENPLLPVLKTALVTLESGDLYDGPEFMDVPVTVPPGKSINDLIFTLYFGGTMGLEENAVAGRRAKAYPTKLDLAVVFQPYFPYYNYTAGYLRRYRESLSDLLASLNGSSVQAESIRLISSGCESSIDENGTVEPDCPAPRTVNSYRAAQAGLASGWPAPASDKWYANLLDRGLSSAYEYLKALPQDSHNVRRALIFTNWLQWEPGKTPPVSPTANGWANPFADEVGLFRGSKSTTPGVPDSPKFELDAVDFNPSGILRYWGTILNEGQTEQRFPFDLDKHFNLPALATSSARPELKAGESGYLVLQNPYPSGVSSDWDAGEVHLSGAQKKRLFPWINKVSAAQMFVKAGESQSVEISADTTMSRLSIGVTASVAGTETTLLRPDGTVVPVTQVGDTWTTDDPRIEYVKGSDYYLIRAPEPGTWRVRVRGANLSGSAQVRVNSYTDSLYRVDEQVPNEVRPGESIAVSVNVGGAKDLLSPTTRMEFRRLRGSVYEIGSRVSVATLEKDGGLGSSDSGRYTGQHTVSGYEGPLEYRVFLDGRDGAGNAVHRETDGAIFVRGSPPQITPLGPYAVTSDPFPLVQARITDDAALKSYAVRIDGRSLSVSYDAATGIASARPGTALAFGEHTVEVTAADQIDQEATPEIWTFDVGPGLLATDPAGDDHGPGYYGYPTSAAKYPANSFDLRTFRVGQSAGAAAEQVSLTVGLGALAAAVRDVNQVVDVYLDADGLVGSGRTDLLPGRNVTLRAEDAWEYVVTLSGEAAVLRDAAGTQWPLALDIQTGARMLTAYVPFARLGIGDPSVLASFGYTVLVLGRDGLNNGGVREVSTLGGANSFSGGAEGNVDPNVIDLLAPSGTTQESMLAGYSVAEGRRAVIAAYRFGGGIAADETAPVITELAPAGAWDPDPPSFACRVRDDREVDAGSITLTVDGSPVDPMNLIQAGDARNKTVGYMPSGPLGAGEHRYVFGAGDKAGNHVTASGVFTLGATARIARLCGRERSEGLALGGDCRIEGTAVGGAYVLEASADGATWPVIAQGGGPVVDGPLGTWAIAGLADGQWQVRLRVAAAGGELTDAMSVLVDNTAPTVAIDLVGGVGATEQPDLKGPAQIEGRVEDAHLAQWLLEAGAGSSPTVWTPLGSGTQAAAAGTVLASWNTAAGIDFDWTLRLTGEDGAGNKTVRTALVHVDNTPPRVALTSPAEGATIAANARLQLEGEVYDARMGTWALEYGAGTEPSSWEPIGSGDATVYQGTMATWDTLDLPAGVYTLRLTAKDRAGSETQVVRAVTLSAAPLARIAGVGPLTPPSPPGGGEGGYLSGVVEVRGTASFPVSGSWRVEASANGTDWTQIASGTMPVTDGVLASWATGAAGDGAYTVRLVVTDADDTTAGDQRSVLVDNTAPVVAISSPAEGAAIGGRIEITGTAADANLSSYTVEWGAGVAPSDWTGLGSFSPASIDGGLLAIWETKGLEVGAYTLRLRAGDQAGSVTELLRAVQVTTDSIAPVVALDTPADGTVSSAANVDVNGSVTDTALASWSLTAEPFVDGAWGAAQSISSGTVSASGLLHSWEVSALEGRYRLTLTGLDAAGNAASAAVEVIFVHGAGYAAIEGAGTLSMPFETPLPPFAKLTLTHNRGRWTQGV